MNWVNPCIIDENIDLAIRLDCLLEKIFNIWELSNISSAFYRISAKFSDVMSTFCSAPFRAALRNVVSARFGKTECKAGYFVFFASLEIRRSAMDTLGYCTRTRQVSR
jgi:hypothetical protein